MLSFLLTIACSKTEVTVFNDCEGVRGGMDKIIKFTSITVTTDKDEVITFTGNVLFGESTDWVKLDNKNATQATVTYTGILTVNTGTKTVTSITNINGLVREMHKKKGNAYGLHFVDEKSATNNTLRLTLQAN